MKKRRKIIDEEQGSGANYNEKDRNMNVENIILELSYLFESEWKGGLYGTGFKL